MGIRNLYQNYGKFHLSENHAFIGNHINTLVRLFVHVYTILKLQYGQIAWFEILNICWFDIEPNQIQWVGFCSMYSSWQETCADWRLKTLFVHSRPCWPFRSTKMTSKHPPKTKRLEALSFAQVRMLAEKTQSERSKNLPCSPKGCSWWYPEHSHVSALRSSKRPTSREAKQPVPRTHWKVFQIELEGTTLKLALCSPARGAFFHPDYTFTPHVAEWFFHNWTYLLVYTCTTMTDTCAF